MLRAHILLLLTAVLGSSPTHALPHPLCPGTCSDQATPCGADSDCATGSCAFDPTCLPGLAPLIAQALPDAPGTLADLTQGWQCGHRRCSTTADALRVDAHDDPDALTLHPTALPPGNPYLILFETQATPGSWISLEVHNASPPVATPPHATPTWTRQSLFIDLRDAPSGAITLALRAGGSGTVALRNVLVLQLRDFGLWLRFRILAPTTTPTTLALSAVLHHGDDATPSALATPCPAPAPCLAAPPTLTLPAGEPGPWLPTASATDLPPASRATWFWTLTPPQRVLIEFAWRPADDAVLARAERPLDATPLALVLPVGRPTPAALAALPLFAADALARDRAVALSTSAPTAFQLGLALAPRLPTGASPPALPDLLSFFGTLGMNVAALPPGPPSPESLPSPPPMTAHYLHPFPPESPNILQDFDPPTLASDLDTWLASPDLAPLRAAPRATTLSLTMAPSTRDLPHRFAGPHYEAAFHTFLAARTTAAALGVDALEALLPPETPADALALRPALPLVTDADHTQAQRFVWSARFMAWTQAQFAATRAQALARAGFDTTTDAMSDPRVRTDRLIGETAALAPRPPSLGFEGDFTLGAEDDCHAGDLAALAAWATGVTRPQRDSAAATGTSFPLLAHVSAPQGDLAKRLLTLASYGFNSFIIDGYGPLDYSLSPSFGGLGEASRAPLAQVTQAADLLRRASLLAGATRPAPTIAILASESDPLWTDTAALSPEELGWHLALHHAHIPVDFLPEREVATGLLESPLAPIRALVLARRHVSRDAWAAISRWVEHGGTLILTGPMAPLDALGAPDPTRDRWLSVLLGRELPEGDTLQWASTGGLASFRVLGPVHEFLGLNGTKLAVSSSGAPVALALQRGRGKVIAIGAPLGATYRSPTTLCDRRTPPALAAPPTTFSRAIRDVIVNLVAQAGVAPTLRTDHPALDVQRLRARDQTPLILVIPWSSDATTTTSLSIPELQGCPLVRDLLEGVDLPLTFGSILLTLDRPRLLTWDRTRCAFAPPEPPADTGDVAEPPPPEHDSGGCTTADTSPRLMALLIILLLAHRRLRSSRVP